MEKNTQLPVEVVNAVHMEAEEIYNKLDELARDQDSYDFGLPMFNKVKEPIEKALTAYASKLHQAQRELELADTMLNDAHDLLREVFRTHESGLMPEQMIYHKIKKFLYG